MIKMYNIKQLLNKYAYLYVGVRFVVGSFSIKKYFRLKKELSVLLMQAEKSNIKFSISKLYPIYEDLDDNAGSLPFHYFFQDLYVAQRIFANNPEHHVDIGSRIDGFVAHVASFRTIEVLDIRPLTQSIPNVKFTQFDVMSGRKMNIRNITSLSCLHVLEHFGLGRYGDPICYDGYLIGFKNITNLLSTGAKLYISVPIGHQRIEFHAHRVFSLNTLLTLFHENFNIDIFSYVDDANLFHENVILTKESIGNNCNCTYGCGIFELTKK